MSRGAMPTIESRNATAIIFSFHSRRKEVIKLLLTFNRAGRAYIIKAHGLPGFLLDSHTNSMSWLYELRMTHNFQIEALNMLEEKEQNECKAKLAEQESP